MQSLQGADAKKRKRGNEEEKTFRSAPTSNPSSSSDLTPVPPPRKQYKKLMSVGTTQASNQGASLVSQSQKFNALHYTRINDPFAFISMLNDERIENAGFNMQTREYLERAEIEERERGNQAKDKNFSQDTFRELAGFARGLAQLNPSVEDYTQNFRAKAQDLCDLGLQNDKVRPEMVQTIMQKIDAQMESFVQNSVQEAQAQTMVYPSIQPSLDHNLGLGNLGGLLIEGIDFSNLEALDLSMPNQSLNFDVPHHQTFSREHTEIPIDPTLPSFIQNEQSQPSTPKFDSSSKSFTF